MRRTSYGWEVVESCAKCGETDILDCREAGCPNTGKFSREAVQWTDDFHAALNGALQKRREERGEE